MAGQIIISNIKTDSDNAFSILANTGAVIFSANLASGITTGIADGTITNAKLAGSISNDKLAGSITGDKITVGTLAGNVFTANTITGDKIGQNSISSNNIVSVNASVASVGTLPTARLPAGSVLQVVSNTKTNFFTTTSTSFVDVTGLSLSITPTSATSKILLIVTSYQSSSSTSGLTVYNLVRNSTNIATPANTGLSFSASAGNYTGASDNIFPFTISFLDSPATTSATTYKVQVKTNTGTLYINTRVSLDSAFTTTITAMEIAV